MSSFFKPYEGARPYFFVSYAHKQSDTVVDTIRILHSGGFRLWYDEGIPAGSDWPTNIARHMEGCQWVLFFLSRRAMESPNCYSEIRTAARQCKPILVVRLEDAEVDEAWRELLAEAPVIPLLDTAEARADAILRSGFVTRRFHRSWTEKIPRQALGFAASLLFFLAAAGLLGALATGRWEPLSRPEAPAETAVVTAAPSPAPVVELGEAERFFAVSFPDSQQERAVRRALDEPDAALYRWQLSEIPALYFCGNMVTDGIENVRFSADGVCRVNGAPVIQGQVSDLSLLESAVRLEKLALICQPLGDLSALSGHALLRELSLAGSTVNDISRLQELPGLADLHLEYTQVEDLRPLETLPGLKTVTVSREMLPLRWSDSANFRVVLVRET